ncbi:hypothetical protein [Nostoc sp. 'Peltigera membranacea cyanobiont' 232]|uniref:hypothetical protein n=1 Tax=Nostoc sp. 'Peltigera membranacea cyanobiont' 232 TaxID=2014531 RepID=UPI000B9578F4|nr:hypothetical protein [Nostoc sp. 'Peltigera membranacea cyanobiont' 232]
MTYCEGSKKVTVTILSPKLTIVVDAPAMVEIGTKTVSFTHPMTAPISESYNFVVIGISLNPSAQTYDNGARILGCPIPSLDGKRISSDFDNNYPDNTGSCSYDVTLQGLSINGVLYPSDDGRFTVSCDDDCPAGKCKCHSDSYPGYCCNDCASTSAKLKAIGDELRSKQ